MVGRRREGEGGGGTRLASAAVRCGASTPPKEVARVGSRPFPSAHSGLHRRAWYCPGLSGICTLCVLGQDSGPVAEFGPLGVRGMPTPTEVLLVLCTQYGTGRNGRCHSRRAPFFTIPASHPTYLAYWLTASLPCPTSSNAVSSLTRFSASIVLRGASTPVPIPGHHRREQKESPERQRHLAPDSLP